MDQNKEKMLILLRCCLCIGGVVGMISNCIGIYYTPIAQSLGVGRGDVALMVTLTSLSTAFFGPVFVRLIRRFRINLVMSFGVLLGVGAYLLMSVAGTIYLFYVAGVIIGISASCFATLPVSLILKDWYKEKNGSMLGIAMAFSGAFAAILNPVLGKIITNFGYQTGFRVMALLLAVICLPCTATMKLLDPQSVQSPKKKAKSEGTAVIPVISIVLLYITAMCFYGQNGMNSHVSALAVATGYTLQFSAMAVSIQNIANMMFKLGFGFLSDRVGATRAASLYLLIGLSGTVCMAFFRSVPRLMLMGPALYAANFSVSTVGSSVLAQKVAKDRYADVYSRQTILTTSSYALMTTIYGMLFDRSGSYQPGLIVVICLSVTGLVLLNILDRKTS